MAMKMNTSLIKLNVFENFSMCFYGTKMISLCEDESIIIDGFQY